LELTAAISGARAYIAIAGGIDNEIILGSRATFAKAGVGGIDGGALKVGQVLSVFPAKGTPGMIVPESARPKLSKTRTWKIEVCAGPNDDWIDKPGQVRFFSADWILSAKSDRTGFRLDGPEWSFTPRATNKPPEHGALPSNVIDHGYPMGAINLAGQTPIILMNDGPSMGGFINPYTVPTGSFWKLGQARPGEILNFQEISVQGSQKIAANLKKMCSQGTLLKTS
jgi:urea carboxylase